MRGGGERERVELEAVADERGTGNKRENQIGTTHTWEGLVDQLLSKECEEQGVEKGLHQGHSGL